MFIRKFLFSSGEVTKIHPHSKNKRLRSIGHKMNMVLGMVVVALYYKMRQILQQNATAILLQNEINVYY